MHRSHANSGFIRTARRWLLRFGLAAAVLLAQSVVASHDHDLVNDALGAECEICIQLTTTDGIAPIVVVPDVVPTPANEPIARRVEVADATGILPQPRGPPASS